MGVCFFNFWERGEGLFGGAARERDGVALGERPAKAGRHGAFDVDVEFNFWDFGDDGVAGLQVGLPPLLTLGVG